MRLLLDTHVLIWWLRDNPILGSGTRALISHSESVVLFSVVSCWEASLKHCIGIMDITGTELWASAIDAGFAPIGLEISHIEQLESLPRVDGHRDPFDQLLLSQTKIEADALITHDRALPQYGIRCIGVR